MHAQGLKLNDFCPNACICGIIVVSLQAKCKDHEKKGAIYANVCYHTD